MQQKVTREKGKNEDDEIRLATSEGKSCLIWRQTTDSWGTRWSSDKVDEG